MSEFDQFINVNLDEVVDEGREDLPQVPTLFEIVSAQMKKKAESDYPYIELQCSPVKNDVPTRRLVWNTLSYSPKALWHLKRFTEQALRARGWRPELRETDNCVVNLMNKRFVAIPVKDGDYTRLDPNTYQSA